MTMQSNLRDSHCSTHMHTAPYDNSHDGLIAGYYSVSNHAYVFLFCRKHGTCPFCSTTSMFSSIPMFCQSRINQTFVTHKLMQKKVQKDVWAAKSSLEMKPNPVQLVDPHQMSTPLRRRLQCELLYSQLPCSQLLYSSGTLLSVIYLKQAGACGRRPG